MTADKSSRPAYVPLLIILCGCSFVGALNGNLLTPLLAEMSDEFQLPVSVLGQLVSLASIASAALVLLAGPLADVLGRKRLMQAGLVVMAVAAVAGATAGSYLALAVARLLSGAGSALLLPASLATVGDYVAPERRGRAMGWIYAFTGGSLVIGWPAIAAVAGIGGWRLSFVVFAVLLGVVFVGVGLWFPFHPRTGEALATLVRQFFQPFRAVLGHRAVRYALAANFLSAAYWFGFVTYIGAFLAQTFHLSVADLSPLFSVIGVCYFVGAVGGGRLTDRLGTKRVAVLATLAGAVLLVPVTSALGGLLGTLVLGGVFVASRGASISALGALVLELAPEARATVMAVSSSLFGLGIVTGASSGGLALAAGGYPWLGVLLAVYAAASFLLLLLRVPPVKPR